MLTKDRDPELHPSLSRGQQEAKCLGQHHPLLRCPSRKPRPPLWDGQVSQAVTKPLYVLLPTSFVAAQGTSARKFAAERSDVR